MRIGCDSPATNGRHANHVKTSITSQLRKRVKTISDAKSSTRFRDSFTKSLPADRSDIVGPVASPTLSVQSAFDALMNSRVITTEEKGGLSSVNYTYPATLVGILRSAFPATRSYDFQMHLSTAIGTSGGGALLSYVPWSPLATTYVEWSALSALFDEVKLISSHMTWTSVAASTTIPCQITLAPDYVVNGSVPSSFTTVMRLAESAEFSSHLGASAGGSTTIHRLAKPPRSRPYATTATPATTAPPAGLVGQWSFATSNASTASVAMGQVVLRNVVRLRMRA